MLIRKLIGTCNHVAQYDLRAFSGRIFVVSDLHGHYDLLHEALAEVAFDSTNDLLFVLGDWTDRGPDSRYVLDYINEPWIHSLRGNHCQMFIDGFEAHWHPNNRSVLCLKAHGGEWIGSLTDLEKILIHEAFSSIPLGIELLLPHGRKVGMVHAEVPYNDWDKWVDIVESERDHTEAVALWSRRWYDSQFRGQVKGVDFAIAGHTPTDSGNIERLGNMLFIDGGSFFNNKINLVQIDDKLFRSMK